MVTFDFSAIAYAAVGDKLLTEELLGQICDSLRALGAKDDELVRIKRDLRQNVGITGTKGFGLYGHDQHPWLDNRRSQISWIYSDAWKSWMVSEGRSKSVIRAIERDAESILEQCGDPSRTEPWYIRGLVMGDVQSGKTGSYSALVNKAVDAGYRIIVLLTGTSNELRSQTQQRLDEAFVGRESDWYLNVQAGASRDIGVQPRRGRDYVVLPMTSYSSDFLTANSKVFLGGTKLSFVAKNSPVLLVMKKNKHPLEQLINYLDGMGDPKYSELPLLLIDDEADNASVNTKDTRDSGEDPATINRLIREILGKFERRTYCAYTATPFANVFIDPDDNTEIFPDNFIYVLTSPASYIGVTQMFGDEGSHRFIVKSNATDMEKFFPKRHKKNHPVHELPETLRGAIKIFFLTCALRDIRGETLRHRTMLVNVSLFNNVQAQLTELVSEYVDDLLQQIRQYMKLDSAWSRYPELADLERRYQAEFPGESKWDEVRAVLYDSVSNVKTLLVNQSIKDANERLNYRRYEGERLGRRVIAIGGLTLSRGLTLEGLSTSYFYRHSKAYDTLLQMGRWFGYRPGYDDLCRVWMDTDAKQWYTHIASAVTELRADLNQMMLTKQTPRDFSIRVKSHESGLIVTARNKMRSSKEIVVDQNFSGRVIETPLFYRNVGSSAALNSNNLEVVKGFFSTIADRFDSSKDASKARLWTSVDKVRVAALIEQLEIPPQNLPFMRDADGRAPIVEFIRDADSPKMQHWDVVLQQGTSEEISDFFGDTYPDGDYRGFCPVTRRFDKPRRTSTTIGVNRSRIGQRLDTTHGMSDTQLEAARLDWESNEENAKTSPSATHFCKFRSSPVLTIYVIRGNSLETVLAAGLKKDLDNQEDLEQGLANNEDLGSGVYVGISIGFPGDASSNGRRVRYRLNLIAQRNAGLVDDDDDIDENSDDMG